MGAALGNVILGQAQQINPDWVAGQMDELWAAKDPVARDNDTGGLTYYFTHANRGLGRIQWDHRMSVPTARVYYNERTKTPAYVAYNPQPYPQLVTVFKSEKEIGKILVPACSLVREAKLLPATAQPAVVGTMPKADETRASRFLDTIYVAFNQPVDAKTLAGVTIAGPGAPALTPQPGADVGVAVFKLGGRLKVSQTYRVTVPATVRTRSGQPALANAYSWAFTVEDQPPLAIVKSSAANGQERVPLDLKQIEVVFNAAMNDATLRNVKLNGAGAPGLQAAGSDPSGKVVFNLTGPLAPDETYTLAIPTSVLTTGGARLGTERRISFSTAPPASPPNVYQESFAGGGFSHDGSVLVDTKHEGDAHSGRYAIKLTAGEKGGSAYFFAGTSDHGDGRVPLDLTQYQRLEFWMKGTSPDAWIKIGHPVFDKAFHQVHLEGITTQYQRFTIEIPVPKNQINTLLVVSVPAGKTLYLDDVRFVKAGS